MFRHLLNYLRHRRFFNFYKKVVKENQIYLLQKYGLEFNFWYELYATVSLADAPDDVKNRYGNAYVEHELNTYIQNVRTDLERFDLRELVKRIDLKRIDPETYGIAFGFAPVRNRLMVITGIVLNAVLFMIMTALGIIFFL